MIGQFIVFFFIAFKLFFLIAFYPAGNFFILFTPVKIALNHKNLFTCFNLLGIYWVKIAFAQAEVVNSIKHIGFARSVITRKNVHRFRKTEISVGVVLEIEQGNVF
ncbi:hypothetical protein D3C73_1257810 [compost metagenome]